MAIQFEFYKNPQAKEEGEAASYHPRVINYDLITTQRLAKEIQKATTFGESEVEAMLMALSRCMADHLGEGQRVHLDGIGYFQIALKTTEPILSPAARAEKVVFKTINFKPDKELKDACMMDASLERSAHRPHSASLSEEEIDRKLTEYFTTHPVLTRNDMQTLCHFTQSMADRQIRRLKAEGKLKNIGKRTQPIYVAGEGV